MPPHWTWSHDATPWRRCKMGCCCCRLHLKLLSRRSPFSHSHSRWFLSITLTYIKYSITSSLYFSAFLLFQSFPQLISPSCPVPSPLPLFYICSLPTCASPALSPPPHPPMVVTAAGHCGSALFMQSDRQADGKKAKPTGCEAANRSSRVSLRNLTLCSPNLRG